MRSLPHPRTRDRLRWVFARFGIVGLTALFVLALAIGAALLALGLTLDGTWPKQSFPDLWRDQLMELLNLNTGAPDANTGSEVAQALALVRGLLALILPGLYVGAIVFRLFIHPKVFFFRRKVALIPSPETFAGKLDTDGHVLAFRVYNSSPVLTLDVNFQVVHQHWRETDAGRIVRNINLTAVNPNWPKAERHVPYTLFVPLEKGDVASSAAGALSLVALGGRRLHERDRLVVHVRGMMPEVGDEFVERQAFDLSRAVSNRPYADIEIDYGRRWARGRGLRRFED